MPTLSADHQERIRQLLAVSPVMPVITIRKPEHALPLCQALVAGGIRVLEITLRTPEGLDAIREVSAAMPDDVWVGAGTVVSREQYREAEQAGANFVVSPGSTEPLLDFAVTASVPLLPGISTVSELMVGYNLGYRAFKFFPAEVCGGIPALRAFAGPFPDVVFCPTGGITPQLAGQYLALGNVATVGGSWLTPEEPIRAGNWQGMQAVAEETMRILGPGFRPGKDPE
jgi:2-dehydro-3-deoxyphosphogluconate aldolase/(4S)-4-hydroxy-2-oxoglutarate aldolase